ncbi:MAG TPA: helix-turn-helix domain-containing protein [Oligoflexia bacterium]|nr:helix-turn-helix domain-containing protein [Oligoflexia bacterium]HMP49726.1 helix-turn-helix domain-containing protein [Oligoflexia bacterium]
MANSRQKVFTTGQVAKLCKVAPRTVSKWFDSGRLKGYRIPGSQDRRIPREYLVRFLKEHGMPLGDIEDTTVKILVISQDDVLFTLLDGAFTTGHKFQLLRAGSSFEAGIQVEKYPDCILIDFSIGENEAIDICKRLREHSTFSATTLIALVPNDGRTLVRYVDEVFWKPFDVTLLLQRVNTLFWEKGVV